MPAVPVSRYAIVFILWGLIQVQKVYDKSAWIAVLARHRTGIFGAIEVRVPLVLNLIV